MFSACMIGGSLYGNGRKFESLTAHQRVTAVKVSYMIPETFLAVL